MGIDWQTTFYIVAVLFMIAWIGLLVSVIMVLWKVRRTIDEIKQKIADNIVDKVSSGVVEKVAGKVVSGLTNAVKEKIRR